MLKVAFSTEGARVGRKTNFERLILEVTTDGTIKPARALSQAAEFLRSHFERISASFPEKSPSQPKAKAKVVAGKPRKATKKRASSKKK